MLRSLAGMHIGIIGDSMARQLFQRFTFFFRNHEGPVFDGFFHGAANYFVNEHEDCLSVQDQDRSCEKVLPILKISYVREISPVAHDWKYWETVKKQKHFTALVVLNGYHYKPLKVNIDKLVNDTVKKSKSLSVTGPTFVLSTPVINGKSYVSELNLQWERQAKLAEKLFFVDFAKVAALAQKGTWVNADDQMHYECSGYPGYDASDPKPVEELKAWRKAVKAYNCDDPVNAALVETILTVLSSQKRRRALMGPLEPLNSPGVICQAENHVYCARIKPLQAQHAQSTHF